MTVLRWISIAFAALVFAAPAGSTTVVQHDGAENRLVQRINLHLALGGGFDASSATVAHTQESP